MNDRLSKLAAAVAAYTGGDDLDPEHIYQEAVELLQQKDGFEITEYWKTLLAAASALNDAEAYMHAGEIFESLVQQARDYREIKVELSALEGVAHSWISLGDRSRALEYLHRGQKLALRFSRRRSAEQFQKLIERNRDD